MWQGKTTANWEGAVRLTQKEVTLSNEGSSRAREWSSKASDTDSARDCIAEDWCGGAPGDIGLEAI